MRIKKPRHASLDEVKISREEDGAVIEFADRTISTTHFKIGRQVRQMSDQAILNMFNDMMFASDQLAAEYENIVIEIPPGQPQIELSERSDQWVPRGDVLRCFIEDGGPDGEVTVYIDDQELSLREFGKLLLTHARTYVAAATGDPTGAVRNGGLEHKSNIAIHRRPREG